VLNLQSLDLILTKLKSNVIAYSSMKYCKKSNTQGGMGMKVFLYIFDQKDLLYTKIYTKDRTVVCPYPPVNIVMVDDSDDEE